MIDLTEARAYGHLGDRAADLAASRRAADKARAQGARLILAQALLWEASIHWDFGEQQAALPLFDEAREIFAAAGDRSGVARVHNMLGAALYNQHGDLVKARREFEASLAIQRDIGDPNGAALSLMNLASIRADEGDAQGARASYQEALAGFRETGDRPNQKLLLFNLATVQEDLGDLPAAKKALDESLEIARKLDSPPGTADALYGLASLQVMTGELAAARRSAEEALAIQEKHEMPTDAAMTRNTLADILLEQGHVDDAERTARAALQTFSVDKSVPHGALSDTVIARCLLARGRIDEARDVAARAHAEATRAGNAAFVALASIVSGRVRSAAGDSAGALADLAALDVSHAPLAIRLEARLALGEAEIAAGHADSGRARLAALEKEAKAGGFALVARKAEAARKHR
jgi:tetratricopeptide (TPR) repeat protein